MVAEKRSHGYSALSRPLDPQNYFTNLLIVCIAPLAGLAAGLWALLSGETFWQATQAGFWTGAATFLTWATAREIDPDNDYSAFVGVAIVNGLMLAWGAPPLALLSLVATMSACRLVNRIAGLPAKLSDSLLFLGGAIGIAASQTWIVLIGLMVMYLLDGLLAEPQRWQVLFSLATLVVLIIRLIFFPVSFAWTLTNPYTVVLVVSFFFFLTILLTRRLRVGNDLGTAPLDLNRIRATMLLVLITALAVALWHGNQGVIWFFPIWAAIAGILLYRMGLLGRGLGKRLMR